MNFYVKDRLDKSVKAYQSDMEQYANALSSYNSISVLKRINKNISKDQGDD